MTNELTLPQRAAVALGTAKHEIELRALVKSSADILAVTNIDGREQAHRAAMTLRNARTAITKTGKEARDDATAFSKAVIAEEKRLIGIIEPEEERVFGLRDGFDAKCEAERQAKIAGERTRVDAIKLRIDEMRRLPACVIGRTSAQISETIYAMVHFKVLLAEFEEFFSEAESVRLDVLDQLAKAETAQRGIEIEAESKRQEAARLEAERQAEAERMAAERIQMAKERAEMAELAAEQERIAKAAQAAQQAVLDAVQAKVDALQAEAKRHQDAEIERFQREEEKLIQEVQELTKNIDLPQSSNVIRDHLKDHPISESMKAEIERQAVFYKEPEKPKRPTDDELTMAVSVYYSVSTTVAREWLADYCPILY